MGGDLDSRNLSSLDSISPLDCSPLRVEMMMWRMYHNPFSLIKETEEVRMMSPHLNMVLVARLDLDCSISKERKFTWVADVHLKTKTSKR